MRLLALDIGSSSVKAAVIINGRVPRESARVSFATTHAISDSGEARSSVRLTDIESAICAAIKKLGRAAQRVDLIAAATMAPSWIALDRHGNALTDVITHQDRRSVAEAREIERRVGQARHLRLAGNRPFPGGISSTTWAWHLAHAKTQMKRAALVGHLGTWLSLALTGRSTIDLSNAGFTGLLDVQRLAWSDELIDAVGIDRAQLPDVVESNEIVGQVTAEAAKRFSLTQGTPLLAGCIDGSAAMFAAGAKVGQLVNVCGSTDVLAQLTDAQFPHADLLTRPLGVGQRWLSVGTIAAAGSAIEWARRMFYSDLSETTFFAHLTKLTTKRSDKRTVASERSTFNASLAGSRTSMESTFGSIERLTLSSTRDDVLLALIDDLAARSGERFATFARAGLPSPRRELLLTGGLSKSLAAALHREWPRGFRFRDEAEATSRGLAALAAIIRK